ncbi:SURF1 family protein [Streptomyces sp. TS71-3]|uniref:SURF1 family protein n=1 Tax=Streptomyces sp. TS71-3 TaxID=2733862 RepID=UPI001AFD6541|nr:SURF1 family protein [Streptomyces sp. TS71-3]GHJ39995.1 SURF1-like protein [Streptomyces sp. TS71-3]
MYRFLLTPRWWGINVFALLAIPLCIFMGTWQLSRFEGHVRDQREADQATSAAHRAAPRPLDSLLPVSQLTTGERATATGHYADQFLVPHRSLDGKDGSYVLTLLRTDSGRAVPVVRGWLPGPPRPGAAPAPPSGEVTVTGALQASETPGDNGVTGAGGLPSGQVGMISAASLVNLVPYRVYDAWITLDAAAPGLKAVPATAPEGGGLDLKAFQNLGYTGEWFVFAAFVVFMWFRLARREAEMARDARLGLLDVEGRAADAARTADAAQAENHRTASTR